VSNLKNNRFRFTEPNAKMIDEASAAETKRQKRTRDEEVSEVDELLGEVVEKSDIELIFDGLCSEMVLHGFPPIIFRHQLLTLINDNNVDRCTTECFTMDSGGLDLEIENLRRKSTIKLLSSGNENRFDLILMRTTEYMSDIRKHLNRELREKLEIILLSSNNLRFQSGDLLNYGLTIENIHEIHAKGFLRRTRMDLQCTTESHETVYWLTHPVFASIDSELNKAQQFILKTLKKSKYKEMKYLSLKKTYEQQQSNLLFPWRYIFYDLLAKNIIIKVNGPCDFMIRLPIIALPK
jgi:hypothetical protein